MSKLLVMKRQEVEERFGRLGALVIASNNFDEPGADITIFDYTRDTSEVEVNRVRSKWWDEFREVAKIWAPFYDTGEDLTEW